VPDIAVGDATGGHVKIGTGTGEGHFTFLNAYDDLAYEVIIGGLREFTGDGMLDVVASGDPNFQGIEGELVPAQGQGRRFVRGLHAVRDRRIRDDTRPTSTETSAST
jgi:hypothetical protein